MQQFEMLEHAHFCPAADNDIVLIFSGRKILVYRENDKFRFPHAKEVAFQTDSKLLKFGHIGEYNCLTGEIGIQQNNSLESLDLREVMQFTSPAEAASANRARQLLYWLREHQFCGVCGNKTEQSDHETAKVCPECGEVSFPRVSPAVITAITKGDQMLLAHNRKFKKGLYSLVAGFVEAGESLEQAVAREIKEEVGVEVKNIKYFGSQGWPFPHSLMVGFTAEYADGEITPDGKEIVEAQWFDVDKLPYLPSSTSISRKIIDSVIEKLSPAE
ncbi:MAG: NAD(+) diphosphatase [Lentisphaerae bacterium]|nr:NAD(+) diphosphatase [Lentisphaerota bacterium]MCP4100556.1 NAD(+) diphosphatase [Lentisphaerota bacterium]